ncbi:9272_t:CDS:2, partial [Racocetra persica]
MEEEYPFNDMVSALACLDNSPNHDSSSLDTDDGVAFLSSKM